MSADGLTLTLTAAEFFKGDYTVSVPFEVVKGIDGQYAQPINQIVTVKDLTAPVLSSATATVKATTDNIKLVTLTFNEDVASIDAVKISGVNYFPALVGNKATIVVDLDATKAYDVTVINATDVVGNTKDVQIATVNLTVDNIAPSITGVVATGENTFKVTLDKAIVGILVVSGKIGAFTANVITSAVVNSLNAKEYTVTVNSDYLFKNGNSDTVTLTVLKGALTDVLGNTNATDIIKTVVLAKDATAPTVAKVENIVTAGKVTGFTVTYSEAVQNVDTSKISVVNAKGEILSFGAVVDTAVVSSTDATKVVFTLQGTVAPDKYGFDFAEGFVTDKSLTANKLAKNAFTVDVTDAAQPVETAFTIVGATAAAGNIITVDFGAKVKATGSGSALNPASYQINGTVLPSTTVIAFNGAVGDTNYQTKVDITVPAGFVIATDTKAIFRVTGIQTLDNKTNNAFMALVNVTDNTVPEAKSFVATDIKEVTVTYSEPLAAIIEGTDVTDEVNLFDNLGASVTISSATVTNGKLVLTIASDASLVTKLNTVTTTAQNASLKDATGNIQKAGLTLNK